MHKSTANLFSFVDFLHFWLDTPATACYYRKRNRISVSRDPDSNISQSRKEKLIMKTLEALLKEINESEALQKKFAEATESDTLVEFLKGQGCDATLEELVSYVKAKEGPKAELSDEELSEVSGGRNKKCVTIFGKKLCI